MKRRQALLVIVFCVVVVLAGFAGVARSAGDTGTFYGKITDAGGRSVAGAEVSFFKTKNVKKPADFVSNRTGEDGKYQVVLPAGVYWAFATLRQNGKKFGPLGLNDKHSGEALEVTLGIGEDSSLDLVVLDLREAAKKVQNKNETLLRVSGRILDMKGKPVKLAYAIADIVKRFKTIPKYLSAWTDESGQYLLFLPSGRYYLGASAGFPPDADYSLSNEILIDKDRAAVDLTLSGRK